MKYLMIPLALGESNEVDGVLYCVRHGIVPHWCLKHEDVQRFARVIEIPSCPECGSDLNALPAGVLACSGCEYVRS